MTTDIIHVRDIHLTAAFIHCVSQLSTLFPFSDCIFFQKESYHIEYVVGCGGRPLVVRHIKNNPGVLR